MKVLESSLNLRVDRKTWRSRTNLDYSLSKDVAEAQLQYGADLYCNVEYMECMDEEYLYEFSKAGYKRITALFGQDNRGILCYIKKDYSVQIIKRMIEPHFLHFKASKKNESYDIIVFRILVSNGSPDDFKDRLKQWNSVISYIDKMEDTSRIILTGDWNHAKIHPEYIEGTQNQLYFNYQKIKADLKDRKISMGIDIQPGHKEHSYKGYLAIDHIAIGEGMSFTKKPEYSDYDKNAQIGKPDHAYLFSEIN